MLAMIFAYGLLTKILAAAALLLVAAAVIWAFDLCLAAFLNRIGLADDIKIAVRALIAVVIFVAVIIGLLAMFEVLPPGWI